MNIGFIQILFIILVGFLLFGNFPAKVKELAQGFKILKKELREDNEKEKKNLLINF